MIEFRPVSYKIMIPSDEVVGAFAAKVSEDGNSTAHLSFMSPGADDGYMYQDELGMFGMSCRKIALDEKAGQLHLTASGSPHLERVMIDGDLEDADDVEHLADVISVASIEAVKVFGKRDVPYFAGHIAIGYVDREDYFKRLSTD